MPGDAVVTDPPRPATTTAVDPAGIAAAAIGFAEGTGPDTVLAVEIAVVAAAVGAEGIVAAVDGSSPTPRKTPGTGRGGS